jgi:hypothetical protein
MAFITSSSLTGGDAAGTTLVFTPPSAWATNAIVILQLYLENQAQTPSFDRGTWTKITSASGKNNNAAVNFETHIYWARWDGSTSNVTISWDGGSYWRILVASAYDNRVTSGDPQDATATYNESEAGSGTVTATAVTTGNANADVVAIGSNPNGRGHAWSGVTERNDFGGQSMADTNQVSAGSSGNKTATVTSTPWSAGLMALKNVAAGGSTPEKNFLTLTGAGA